MLCFVIGMFLAAAEGSENPRKFLQTRIGFYMAIINHTQLSEIYITQWTQRDYQCDPLHITNVRIIDHGYS